MTIFIRRSVALAAVCLLLLSLQVGCSGIDITDTTSTTTTESATLTTTSTSKTTVTTTQSTPQSTTTTITTTTTTTTTITTTTTTTTSRTTTTTKQTTTRSTTKPTASRPTINIKTLGSHRIDVPIIAQKSDYPSGCESVSAVMLLKYWGEKVTVDEFIDNHLPQSSNFYTKNGRYYGPDPYEYFIGSPRSTQSYGCMAPVIHRAIDSYYGSNSPVIDVSGATLPELCAEHIANDRPVLVWVSIGMLEIYDSAQWYFEDGTLYSWPANEHCMVLVGYDTTYYYFNDPYTGQLKKYPHWLCEDRYQTMGKQALVIKK